jgi:hypothetical protein
MMPKISPKQLTLGQLTEMLSAEDREKELVFDFLRYSPADIQSYRGYHEDLAVFPGKESTTVQLFLKKLRDALQVEFCGYKGGWYKPTEDTALWVAADRSSTTNTVISGVRSREDGDTVVLRTNWIWH